MSFIESRRERRYSYEQSDYDYPELYASLSKDWKWVDGGDIKELDSTPDDVFSSEARVVFTIATTSRGGSSSRRLGAVPRPAREKSNAVLTLAGTRVGARMQRSEIAMEMKVFIATAVLVLVTWLLYKLAAWLEPRP